MHKQYQSARKAGRRVEELKKSVRRLNSLLTSQRHYYRTKLCSLELTEITEIRHEECLQREEELKARISHLEDEISKMESERAAPKKEIIFTKDKDDWQKVQFQY